MVDRTATRSARVSKAKFFCLALVLCIACFYRWATRELSLMGWIVCRIFELQHIKSIFHPDHFSRGPHETDEAAMQARRAAADELVMKSGRVLQGEMAEVHDVNLAVKGGQVPMRLYIPKSSSGRSHAYKGVLLWFHGGGWMFGSVNAFDHLAQDLAEASGMIVVNVGYRKAPEVKFPVPVGDCLAAVRWVRSFIWAFGGDKTRIALVGESAGGNLALATALRLGMSWIPFMSKKSELCAVVAASPPVSYEHAEQGQDGGDGEWRSYKRYWSGYGLEGGQMKGYWDAYLSKQRHGRSPLASPLRASKRMLRGLPPVMLIRAEHEILWDEIAEMGRNMADAGHEVEEFQSKACVHGSFAKAPGACGVDSLEAAGQFLKRHCS